MIVEQLIVSFIASTGFAVLFNVPYKSLWQCGSVGMLGWLVYIVLARSFSVNIVIATLIASIIVGVISQIFAKWFRTPIVIFNLAGIIPLVPGGLAYEAVRFVIINEYELAIAAFATVLMLAGAIALGLVVSEIVNHTIRNNRWRRYQSIFDRKGVTR